MRPKVPLLEVLRPAALAALLLTGISLPSVVLLPEVAQATTRKADAKQLLSGMHRSLATIVVAYGQKPQSRRSPADALMLEGARDAARELNQLKSALTERNGRRVSVSMRKMSQAVGRLQGTYRMVSVFDPTVAEGMRALSANWAAFSAHYALAPSTGKSKSVTQAQLQELKQRVARLEAEIAHRRTQFTAEPLARREVEYVYVEVERINSRPITFETYQSTLLSLSFISGTMVGYAAVSEVYSPQFHDYWAEDIRSSAFYEGYWDGYYEGYYDAASEDFFVNSFAVPEAIDVTVDNSINQQVDVYVTQEINVLVERAETSAADFTDLPPRAADISSNAPVVEFDNPAIAAEQISEVSSSSVDIPSNSDPVEKGAPIPETVQPGTTDGDTEIRIEDHEPDVSDRAGEAEPVAPLPEPHGLDEPEPDPEKVAPPEELGEPSVEQAPPTQEEIVPDGWAGNPENAGVGTSDQSDGNDPNLRRKDGR
ncbi:hypothetical protein [Pleomorphomonas oryzae]|uniref:hypothetical protein n=1 Tax=Pleomorphomonas oryzae TaxID=261934 RepID=UPI0004296F75|nr:hypothetical protein [Pleomorphomonas oryzae]